MFVVIGNPPYNVGQVNENDNNKNRKYLTADRRVRDTYVKGFQSHAQKCKLCRSVCEGDPLGIGPHWRGRQWSPLVTNNSFLDAVAFDGMRKHLADDFDAIYILDLGGNVRKNPKLSGTTHNVFGIQVGVSINFFSSRRTARQMRQSG